LKKVTGGAAVYSGHGPGYMDGVYYSDLSEYIYEDGCMRWKLRGDVIGDYCPK
jgi:hypothetical protein